MLGALGMALLAGAVLVIGAILWLSFPSVEVRERPPAAGMAWIAPGERARRLFGVSSPLMSTQGRSSTEAWGRSWSDRSLPYDITLAARDHLAAQPGGLARWMDRPDAARAEEDEGVRWPLHAAILVSMRPSVVVLVPIADPAHFPDRERYATWTEGLWLLAGTEVPQPSQAQLHWFSPELRRGPEPLAVAADGRAEIPLGPADRLVFRPENGFWRVERTR
ncbi:MAG TPA: hypothetical protein VD970_13105 [Acetobacteraceae bacterium]|nr:hypothetical protein [Acetobacteraceae bacterium]